MNSISILYIGSDSGTSRHRALSLSRLGHKVQTLNPHSFLPSGRLAAYWKYHTGSYGLERFIRVRVLGAIRSAKFDLVWVDAGDLICVELVSDLKRQARFVINYNVDDPYGATVTSGACTCVPFLFTTSLLSFVTAMSPKLSKQVQGMLCECTGQRTKSLMPRENFHQAI